MQDVAPDLLAGDLAEASARDLAPLRAGSSTERPALPRSVRWTEVSQIDLRDREHAAQSLANAWAQGPSTRIALGAGASGAVTIDLRADGPHTLIAGTTGAGKSELLTTIVAGLAAVNRPDQMSLLLIDHKGGATLSRFAALPHTVGVVTDLDTASTRRALQSLGAELRRREALLAAVGAVDLETFLAAGPTDRLGRLLIVVDEFATVADEHPDFVGGLVGVAQRGRSLGLHLILATQRPDGVVSADIRANTRLRICLGVTREQESRDVIDCPDAAAISRTTPGRGYLRVGPGDLRVFQTARIGGTRTAPLDVSASISPAATLGDPLPAPPADLADTDLDVLIDGAREADRRVPSAPSNPPWLPPLPEQLWLADLPRCERPTQVAWGRLDLPGSGAQPPLVCDVGTGGCTLVVGTARSGRTTAVVSMITAVAALRSPDQLRVWAVDSAVGLAGVERLPHCGAVVPAHDTGRVTSLLDHLDQEVSRRRRDAAEWSAAMLLVIDSWDGLANATEARHSSDLVDRIARLAADGPAAGLHTVLTGDRALLTGRLAAVASDRIVLRLADPADFVVIGMSTRDVPRQLPPGRGVRAADLALVQIAMADAATTEAAASWPAAAEPVRRFDPLPERVTLESLRDSSPPAGDQLILGLEADALRTIALHRSGVRRPFLVAGPIGSGRSTALLLIATQLAGRRLAICCTDRSPLASCPHAVRLPRDDQDHAVALLESLASTGAPPDLICDDLDVLAEGPLWARLDDMTRGEPAGDSLLVVAASTEAAATAFRGPLAQARRRHAGLLLGAVTRHDALGFGISLPGAAVDRLDPPGRGWLVDAGTSRRLQLADPALPRSLVRQASLELPAFRGQAAS
jgi:S-DNA-T family DNA segregation ATPase FtsK/SpoIIIE